MSSYVLSRLAQSDIDGIWDYVAEDGGIESAERFVWRLYDLFDLLGHNPSMGRLSNAIARGVRKFPLNDYLIHYLARNRRVLIGRIIHGKRRQEKAYRTIA